MGPGFILHDAILLLLATALYGGAAAAGLVAFRALARGLPAPLALVPALLAAFLALILEIGLLTRLCPRLPPGKHRAMGGTFMVWMLRSLLRRLLLNPALKWAIFSSNLLRWLSLRALQAKVAFAASVSTDVEILDPSLVEIGPGAMIGAACGLVSHTLAGGTLNLGVIRIEPGALVGAACAIGPGCTVGARALLLPHTVLYSDAIIGEEARLGPAALLERGAKVGAKARVGTRVVLKAGECVPDGAVVGREDAESRQPG